MANATRFTVPRIGERVLDASRQAWLATLGAAAVAREWVGSEAAPLFRRLATEGASVESQVMRKLRTTLETRIARGNRRLRRVRRVGAK